MAAFSALICQGRMGLLEFKVRRAPRGLAEVAHAAEVCKEYVVVGEGIRRRQVVQERRAMTEERAVLVAMVA
jgi:hypothetical protein